MLKSYFFFLDCFVLYEAGFLVHTKFPARKPIFQLLTLRVCQFLPEYINNSLLRNKLGIYEEVFHNRFSLE